MKTYNVQVDQYGAEITIGKVSRETYEYWKSWDGYLIEQHLQFDDIESVPPEHNLYPWYEQDDLLHINGPQFCDTNHLTITDAESGEVILKESIFKELFQDNAWVLDSVEETNPNLNGTVLLYCLSADKGCWSFDDIETDQPFDPSKLTFYLHGIDGDIILDHMRYEDQDLNVICSDTNQKDWTFWFDSDFPD